MAQCLLTLGERTALGLPLGEPAIEDRNIVHPVKFQHEPAARRAFHGAVVIDHHSAAIAKPQALHAAGEFLRAGQGVVEGGIAVGQLAQVHEHRAGNVSGGIVCRRIALGIGQMPRGIDNPQVARAHFAGQPIGRYKTVHAAFLR